VTGLVHVPTVPELAKIGLAIVVESAKTGRPTHYSVLKKGEKKILKAQAHNAEILRPLVADVERARKKYLKAQATLAAAQAKEPEDGE
jgi:putative ubiquitin-RnfH superfamily antitoxin RatB of RatAB toxin-antitoxin module